MLDNHVCSQMNQRVMSQTISRVDENFQNRPQEHEEAEECGAEIASIGGAGASLSLRMTPSIGKASPIRTAA